MHRLFVAVRPPAAVRGLLLAAMGGVSGARWQTDEQLHLTLRFIGEVDRHQASDIHAALGAIHHPPFETAVSGIGTFSRRGQPEVIWAGLAPHEPLAALHKKVDQALTRAGVEPDRRAFHPHITLARLKRTSGPVGNLIGGAGGISSPPFTVETFALYESRLTPEGAVYSPIERYPLG
ncbi:MAG TPA: RNA 2',3'-cyclic phosphodiesterase [Allosphingosinicella sp.]|jgi:2'-5' RNA ligase